MAERLLSIEEVSGRLGVSRSTFYEYQPTLIAKGLQRVRAGRLPKFVESSVEKLIKTAAEKDIPLF